MVIVVHKATTESGMKIEPNSMASRYQVAEKIVWAKLAPWQKEAISDDRLQQRDSSLIQHFVKEVIKTAESPDFFASCSLDK